MERSGMNQIDRLVRRLAAAIVEQQTVFDSDREMKQLLIDSQCEIGRLKNALEDICNPVRKWRREQKDDEKLDGVAVVYLLKDPQIYKDIARDALAF
jgi:hypothetical protein